jgi:hypothetical protein
MACVLSVLLYLATLTSSACSWSSSCRLFAAASAATSLLGAAPAAAEDAGVAGLGSPKLVKTAGMVLSIAHLIMVDTPLCECGETPNTLVSKQLVPHTDEPQSRVACTSKPQAVLHAQKP